MNYNIIILLKLILFNAISVTKTVLVLFPTFSNVNWQRQALNFDVVQIYGRHLGFQKMVLGNTYDVTSHVQP